MMIAGRDYVTRTVITGRKKPKGPKKPSADARKPSKAKP